MNHPLLDLNNKTIVVIYMLYFGDMVSITPFLEVLRRAAKGSRILLIMDAGFQEALRYDPNIDAIIPFDRHGKERGLKATWRAGRKLGALHPDILFTLHGTERSSLMAYAMNPTEWIGEPGMFLDRFFMTWPMTIETYDCHAVDKYLHVLKKIGVKNLHHEGMKLYTCPAWERKAESFFADSNIKKTDRLVGLSVGSSTPEKNWPAERFGAVADYFAGKGMIPVFFGIEKEKHLVEKAQSVMSHHSLSAAGCLSLGEFIAAAGRCSLFFTNDSGPMYVADSRGVPTIAMFGPSNAKFHRPLGVGSEAISSWDMPEGPEHVNQIIASGKYVPLTAVTVEQVIAAGERALEKAETTRSSLSMK